MGRATEQGTQELNARLPAAATVVFGLAYSEGILLRDATTASPRSD